jgi:PST family polysaccharide transporter
VSIESLVGGALCLVLALPLASVTVREAVRLMLPTVLAGAVAAVATFALEHSVFHSDQRPIVIGAVMLLADALVFGLVYLVALRVIAPAAFGELTDAFRRLRDMLLRRGGASPADPGPIPLSDLDDEEAEAVTRRFTAYEMALATAAIPLGDFDTIPMRRVPAAPPVRRAIPIRVVPTKTPAGGGRPER